MSSSNSCSSSCSLSVGVATGVAIRDGIQNLRISSYLWIRECTIVTSRVLMLNISFDALLEQVYRDVVTV
jgi:hypothetical protein